MKKERYVKCDRGYYRWKPTKAMQRAGFHTEAFGKDLDAANQRALELNAQWDQHKKEQKSQGDVIDKSPGTFNALVEDFQRDEVWYHKRAWKTRDDMDRAFKRICGEPLNLGDVKIKYFERRHGNACLNTLHKTLTTSAAEKTWKWFRRLMAYARHVGVRPDVPIEDMEQIHTPPREAKYKPEEVQAIIDGALHGGVALGGNGSKVPIPPRRSIALATAIAYDTSLPQGDVLRLTWKQWDGQGFEVTQQKQRGQKTIYVMVSAATRKMMNDTIKTTPHIIVSEKTGKPYFHETGSLNKSKQTIFSNMFRKFRKRAGIEGRHFHDLRRTALSEMGDSGATNAEIVSFSGHSVNSKVIDVYVQPSKKAAKNAHQKRWGKNKG